MDFKDIKTNENTIQTKKGNNIQVTIDGEVSSDIGGNMNLIIAIISYIFCVVVILKSHGKEIGIWLILSLLFYG